MIAVLRLYRPVRKSLLIAAMLAGFQLNASAGLFEDDEARKAILDLRAKVEQNATTASAASDDLKSENAQLRRSLLELNAQIEQLRAGVAQLRGQNEQLSRDLSELQRKQKDLLAPMDERLRALEPTKVVLDGKEIVVEPAERKQYEAALQIFRQGEFAAAQSAWADFMRRNPQSAYQPWAMMWQANSMYALRGYRDALAVFQSIARNHPDHPKAPEALLSAANCQVELKDSKGARKTLEELRNNYPKSEAALAAAERLKKQR
jgi:tol-pal system protein YbgF